MVFHASLIQLNDSTISPSESHDQVQATSLLCMTIVIMQTDLQINLNPCLLARLMCGYKQHRK